MAAVNLIATNQVLRLRHTAQPDQALRRSLLSRYFLDAALSARNLRHWRGENYEQK